MSSVVRVRPETRPPYILDESSDNGRGGKAKGRDRQDKAPPAKRIEREDVKDNACRRCGLNNNLVSCSTCTYAFHPKCLIPCINITSDKWSCPECVSPLTEMEDILDCETSEFAFKETSSSQSISKEKPVKRYLIKWKGLSYIHCTWIPEDEYLEAAEIHPWLKPILINFNKQFELIDRSDDDYVPIRPEWTTVDRVLDSRKNSTGEREYYVKWKELSHEECTWENESDISVFQPQIERYNEILSRRKESTDKRKTANREMRRVDRTPKFLSGGTQHPYQLEGLNFLRYSWSTNRNVILGDEMGLGKTIQSIAFLASSFEDKFGPHLVVAPLSTLRNWEREFATWAPQMNVLVYLGSLASRDIIKKYEFYYEDFPKKLKKNKSYSSNGKKQSRIKFDVLLTSREMITMDSAVLKTIEWECMILDEGHQLMNKDSKLFGLLQDYHTQHWVLLARTQVQNNPDELFRLMCFVEGNTYGSISDLQEELKDINKDKQVEKLHWMLKPHLLRRFKLDVMKDLSPKKELTSKEKEYYKATLLENEQHVQPDFCKPGPEARAAAAAAASTAPVEKIVVAVAANSVVKKAVIAKKGPSASVQDRSSAPHSAAKAVDEDEDEVPLIWKKRSHPGDTVLDGSDSAPAKQTHEPPGNFEKGANSAPPTKKKKRLIKRTGLLSGPSATLVLSPSILEEAGVVTQAAQVQLTKSVDPPRAPLGVTDLEDWLKVAQHSSRLESELPAVAKQMAQLASMMTEDMGPFLAKLRSGLGSEQLSFLERAKQCVTDWDAMHAARIAAESELEAAKKKVEASAIQAQVHADRVLELAREKDHQLMETLADRAKLKEELAAMKAKVTTLEEGNKLSVAALKEAMDANAELCSKLKEEVQAREALEDAARVACSALWPGIPAPPPDGKVVLDHLHEAPNRVDVLKRESAVAGCQKTLVLAFSNYEEFAFEDISSGFCSVIPVSNIPRLMEDARPHAQAVIDKVVLPGNNHE